MNFCDLFRRATGIAAGPFPFQRRFAEALELAQLAAIPTGLGKTAMIVLGWLWRRRFASEEIRQRTPRRLIYCLPMRVLVEQTYENTRSWLEELGLMGNPGEGRIAPHLLMGGEPETAAAEWALHPEEDAVLIGTQDMLLSRALMRGYGMSRYQWPVHYALLHNDAFWVFDEVQLMGPALPTTTQLEAFHRNLGTAAPRRSLWVSATLREEWLDTVDFRSYREAGLQRHTLDDEDHKQELVRRRVEAPKSLSPARTSLRDSSKSGLRTYVENLAEEVMDTHASGAQTLVILNRVDRAQELYDRLLDSGIDLLLVHACFRSAERRTIEQRLHEAPGSKGRIVIATQALEAGVDLDSRVMFTELAPWASMVQRFGRCNRAGDYDDARAFWVDLDEQDKDLVLPYEAKALSEARERLRVTESASPGRLPPVTGAPALAQVLRRRDVMELFNTDPDLAGFDVDVSPYIRDTGTPQLHVFWRAVDRESAKAQSRPSREELCPVSTGRLRDHLRRKLGRRQQKDSGREHPIAFRFDTLAGNSREGQWAPLRAEEIRPGQMIMLDSNDGGYDLYRGFRPGLAATVHVVPIQDGGEQEGYGTDRTTQIGCAVSLDQHLADVAEAMVELADALELDSSERAVLEKAAQWHDVGKAHEAFQRGMGFEPDDPKGPWAKSAHWDRPAYRTVDEQGEQHLRPGFRHELASMLAWLEHGNPHRPVVERDLIAYLIAGHHGRVRLGLRALPDEPAPPSNNGADHPGRLYARGVWEGDRLPALSAAGIELPETELRLDLMKLGQGPQGPSWTERTRRLLERHGPFRLAWFEALVRIADWRASKKEAEK